MKTIINKEVDITSGGTTKMKRSGLLSIVLNTPPANSGINIKLMRDRMKVLDILEDADKGDSVINLEDSPFQLVKKLFDEYPWTAIHKDILELADHLDELEKTK